MICALQLLPPRRRQVLSEVLSTIQPHVLRTVVNRLFVKNKFINLFLRTIILNFVRKQYVLHSDSNIAQKQGKNH